MTQPHQPLIPKPSDPIICFKAGKVKRENLYEMTRKYWKVNILRARNATHALAITDGVVQAVYLPYRWHLTEDPMRLGRYEFDGEEDPGSDYVGQSVREFYGKSQNPIKYINL